MGDHISPAPQMMLLRLTKGGGSTNETNACTNEALTNELHFGIQGHKWGAGEMDPLSWRYRGVQLCFSAITFHHFTNSNFGDC